MAFDTTGDGAISCGEFTRILRQCEPPLRLSKPQMYTLFAAINPNGADRRILPTHFVAFFARLYAQVFRSFVCLFVLSFLRSFFPSFFFLYFFRGVQKQVAWRRGSQGIPRSSVRMSGLSTARLDL